MKKVGHLKKLTLKTALISAVLVSLAFLVACSASVSTANVSDAKTGLAVKDGEVKKETKVFATNAPVIYVSANLNNAPEGTKLTFTWRYLEGDGQDIDSVVVTSESGQNIASSSLTKPNAGWPVGEYEIVIKLDTDNSKPIKKSFSVK